MRNKDDWPDWPGAMKRATAAAYLDMGVAAFEREIDAGNLPYGFMLGGSLHWSRAALDRHLEKLEGGPVRDWRRELGLTGPRA